MTDFSRLFIGLTAEDLAAMMDRCALAPNAHSRGFATLFLSTQVLSFFLHNDWLNEHVYPFQTASRHGRIGREYLRSNTDREIDRYFCQERLRNLSEIVFNMQAIEGFTHRLSQMHKCDLESAQGEWECASLFAHPELNFKFVKPQGKKGEDCDAQISIEPAGSLWLEIKALQYDLSLNAEKLWRIIESARKQLPKKAPGIVVVKLPVCWIDNVPPLQQATARVFRQSNRIAAVLFCWEEWHPRSPGWEIHHKFRTFSNEKSGYWCSEITNALRKLGRQYNPQWLEFKFVLDAYFRKFFPNSPVGHA